MKLRLLLSVGALALVTACSNEQPPAVAPLVPAPPTSAGTPAPPVSSAAVPQEVKATDQPQQTAKPTPPPTQEKPKAQAGKKTTKPKTPDPAIAARERIAREVRETPLPIPPAATQPHYATPG